MTTNFLKLKFKTAQIVHSLFVLLYSNRIVFLSAVWLPQLWAIIKGSVTLTQSIFDSKANESLAVSWAFKFSRPRYTNSCDHIFLFTFRNNQYFVVRELSRYKIKFYDHSLQSKFMMVHIFIHMVFV